MFRLLTNLILTNRVLLAVTIFASAASHAATEPKCIEAMRSIALAQRGLEHLSRERMLFDDIGRASDQDLNIPAYRERQSWRDPSRPIYRQHDSTIARAMDFTNRTEAALRDLGIEVKRIQVPKERIWRDEKLIELPAREVLEIKSGSGQGKIAEELRRIEDYVRLRQSDPAFPKEFKGPVPVTMDPLKMIATQSEGALSLEGGRAVLDISPRFLFGQVDTTIETIRHELRHLKVYFDLMTGKPTVYRGSLISANGKPISTVRGYQRVFEFDELEGFMAHLKSVGSQLGRDAARIKEYRANGKSIATELSEFRLAITEEKTRGRRYFLKIKAFATSITENVQIARDLLRESNKNQFADRLEFVSGGAQYPGQKKIQFLISKPGDAAQTKMELFVPENLATAKDQAPLRQHLRDYFDQLEAQANAMLGEARVRNESLRRDADQLLIDAQ